MTTTAYIGRVAAPSGKTIYKSRPNPTREETAADCRAAKPRAASCSTNEVTINAIAGIEYVQDAGRDIRWHQAIARKV